MHLDFTLLWENEIVPLYHNRWKNQKTKSDNKERLKKIQDLNKNPNRLRHHHASQDGRGAATLSQTSRGGFTGSDTRCTVLQFEFGAESEFFRDGPRTGRGGSLHNGDHPRGDGLPHRGGCRSGCRRRRQRRRHRRRPRCRFS